MKKMIILGSALIFFLIFPSKSFATEKVNSKVGISFYQPTSANEVVPMQQVTRTEEPGTISNGSEDSSKYASYPKTNEKETTSFTIIGLLLLIISSILLLKRRRKHAD